MAEAVITTIRGFRHLQVWQKGMRIALDALRLCRTVRSVEASVLCPQIRRAALSIPSNIAVGYGRGSRGDYLRFLLIANGSLRELETLLEVGLHSGACAAAVTRDLLQDCDELGGMVFALVRRLSSARQSPSWRSPVG